MERLTQEQIEAVKPRYGMFTHYRQTQFKKYPWYARSPLLHYIVQWIIYLSIFYPFLRNDGKYKVGDKVRYNWKGKVHIYTVTDHKGDITRTVSEVLFESKSNLSFTDGSGCAAFWVRRKYFWER